MRLLVVGPPAAGKSTLALDISADGALPVHHVDVLRWAAPGRRRPAGEVRALVEDAVTGTAWVAEGSVGPTVNAFATAADAIVFLDFRRRVTLVRLLGRWARRRRVGMPDGHREVPTLFALRFAWGWRRAHRAQLLRDVQAAGKPLLHLTAPRPDLAGEAMAFARRSPSRSST